MSRPPRIYEINSNSYAKQWVSGLILRNSNMQYKGRVSVPACDIFREGVEAIPYKNTDESSSTRFIDDIFLILFNGPTLTKLSAGT